MGMAAFPTPSVQLWCQSHLALTWEPADTGRLPRCIRSCLRQTVSHLALRVTSGEVQGHILRAPPWG